MANKFPARRTFRAHCIVWCKNLHEPFAPERIQQLIYKNQSVIGFNLPSMHPEQLAQCVPSLLNLIALRQLKIFANYTFPLDQVSEAFAALASRQTTGKVVLIP